MVISLKHKDHGYHTVYTEADAKAHASKGWKRVDMEKEHQLAREKKVKAIEDERRARENALKTDIAKKADAKKAKK